MCVVGNSYEFLATHIFLCKCSIPLINKSEVIFLTDEELVEFINHLPKDCIESKTEERMVFHLPRNRQPCPHCGSVDTHPHGYTLIKLTGIRLNSTFVYRKRRLLCAICGRSFMEDSPILARYQNTSKNKLRQIRGRKKLSQGAVCKQTGIPLYLYKDYEKAENPILPSLPVAEKIASALGVTVDKIWDLGEVQRVTQERELKEKRLLELKKQREKEDAECLSIIRRIETRIKNMSDDEKRQFIDYYNNSHSISD